MKFACGSQCSSWYMNFNFFNKHLGSIDYWLLHLTNSRLSFKGLLLLTFVCFILLILLRWLHVYVFIKTTCQKLKNLLVKHVTIDRIFLEERAGIFSSVCDAIFLLLCSFNIKKVCFMAFYYHIYIYIYIYIYVIHMLFIHIYVIIIIINTMY